MPAELADLPTRGDVELAADVGDVLARLSPQHRAVLVLRDMCGHDEREMSQWLAVPRATVRTRLFRARRRFSQEMAAMSATWPRADLDEVRRLRVIAGAVGGGVYGEVHLAMPPEQVWGVVADLEHELPHLVRDVRSFEYLPGVPADDGVRHAVVRGSWRKRTEFSVVLRPGWCLMQSRFLVGGMAAVAEDGGTRLAFYGAFRVRGLRWLRPLLRVNRARLARDFTRRLRQRLAIRIS